MAKKKEFHEELPTKVCPVCGELSMEEAEICDACGHSFVPQEEPVAEPATAEDEQDIEALFQELGNPDPPAEPEPEDIPVEEPVDEIPPDTLEEVPVEEPIEAVEDLEPVVEEPGNTCPNCGFLLDDDAVFCPVCGEQVGEGEPEVKALLDGFADDFSLVEREKIDFSKAVAGEEIIVRKDGERYEALTAPIENPVKIIDVSANDAEVLKADYVLKKAEHLSVRDIVEAGATLRDNTTFLDRYYGVSDINEIYGDGLSDYAAVSGTKDDLLDIGLPINILQILNSLGAKAQSELAGILNRYEVSDITPTTAKLIVDSDRTEETMRDIVVREKTMQSIVHDYIDMVMNR